MHASFFDMNRILFLLMKVFFFFNIESLESQYSEISVKKLRGSFCVNNHAIIACTGQKTPLLILIHIIVEK